MMMIRTWMLSAALYYAILTCDAFISSRHRGSRRMPDSICRTTGASRQFNHGVASVTRIRDRTFGSSTNDRFLATASNVTSIDGECIFTIQDHEYNLTDWANAHPGGVEILRRFHGKNATKAFFAVGHSNEAIQMLNSFRISASTEIGILSDQSIPNKWSTLSRWKSKLVSREDPQWIHKTLGIYALLHFAFRVAQLMFGKDPAAGFGTNLGKGASILTMACLVPHLLLSCSSLIFDTVPKERVVGKPMIWKENRWHSILFGTRSIVCSALAWLSVKFQHAEPWRTISITGTCLCVLLTMIGADIATQKLSPSQKESSVATLPFWEGCSVQTQQQIKQFYAYTQFTATATCLLVANPAWPFSLLFPIQFASFLLTLCRKGLISAKTWHAGYAASLVLPFFLAIRVMLHLRSVTFISGLLITSMALFQLRRLGVNKYLLWTPMMMARLLVGDRFLPFEMW